MVKKVPEKYRTSDGQEFNDQTEAEIHQNLIDLKTKVTVSWAKITQEMGIKNLEDYTNQGDPVFVVDPV